MGLPLENINKIAGPMIEAWAGEVFAGIRDDMNNQYNLINVEAQERLGMADIVLQFKKGDSVITSNVDVKATANSFFNSLKTGLSQSGYSKGDLNQYIPAILFTLYDGFYVYGPYENYAKVNNNG